MLGTAVRAYGALRKIGRLSGVANVQVGKTSVGRWLAPRLRHWIWRGLGSRDRVHSVRGHRMYLPDPPPVDMLIDNYEPEVTSVLERELKVGMGFVDVGANVGYYSLLAAGRVGTTGKVYAFEPAPGNYHLLKKNAEVNGYANLVAVPHALADKPGTTNLYLSRVGSGWHSLYRSARVGAETVKVAVKTLDDFLEAEGWPRVDALKIDAEGAEFAVLLGMRRLLQRSATLRLLVVEFSPDALRASRTDPRVLLRTLQEYGFRLTVLQKEKKVFVERVLADLPVPGDLSLNLLCERRLS